MIENERCKEMHSFPNLLHSLLFLSFLVGCAFDLVNIKPTPTDFIACENNCESFIVTEEVKLDSLPCGFNRIIKKDTRWKQTGKIPDGVVFKPVETCFTIECSNVFEAYLVIRENMIIGFYLPVEKGFVQNKKPTKITIN
jgi:hypothetical protein